MKKLTNLLIIFMIAMMPISVFATGGQDVESNEGQTKKLTWLILEFWNADSVIEVYKGIEPNVEIEVEKVSFGDLIQQNQIRL